VKQIGSSLRALVWRNLTALSHPALVPFSIHNGAVHTTSFEAVPAPHYRDHIRRIILRRPGSDGDPREACYIYSQRSAAAGSLIIVNDERRTDS
jgi:hypothetical protein